MPDRAEHADTKQRHAHVMDLFFVTVDHRLKRVERVGSFVFLDSQPAAVVWRETAAGER
jgi:hypothetical protein